MRKMLIDPSFIMRKVPSFVVFVPGIRRDAAADGRLNYLVNQTRLEVVDAHSRPDLRKPVDSPLKFVVELKHSGTQSGNSLQFARIQTQILGRTFQFPGPA